jgi:hypothetical protein
LRHRGHDIREFRLAAEAPSRTGAVLELGEVSFPGGFS